MIYEVHFLNNTLLFLHSQITIFGKNICETSKTHQNTYQSKNVFLLSNFVLCIDIFQDTLFSY